MELRFFHYNVKHTIVFIYTTCSTFNVAASLMNCFAFRSQMAGTVIIQCMSASDILFPVDLLMFTMSVSFINLIAAPNTSTAFIFFRVDECSVLPDSFKYVSVVKSYIKMNLTIKIPNRFVTYMCTSTCIRGEIRNFQKSFSEVFQKNVGLAITYICSCLQKKITKVTIFFLQRRVSDPFGPCTTTDYSIQILHSLSFCSDLHLVIYVFDSGENRKKIKRGRFRFFQPLETHSRSRP